ncbi:kelch-like protein 32 isoform X3 [Hypanus sabinus]|uniref:kelch-like protein 32 isoform X3 n=1 Tax=Hypanus sabinus TaxID=79690 RepID=UPI0028C49D86|nr:kelch-like protein 32 isoform X3 [Hypanus sabinus]
MIATSDIPCQDAVSGCWIISTSALLCLDPSCTPQRILRHLLLGLDWNMPSEMCLSIQEMLTGHRLCQSKSHKDAVLAALNQQRMDGILCDVILVAEDQKFHAHKAVLAACSDYFRAMFSLCMVESVAEEVNLHGVTSLGLKQALDFAYTGQIVLEPCVVQDVLAAGSHLQLLELLKLCSHYLIQELTSFNYLDLYKLADLFNLTLLEEAVVNFLVKHLSELLKNHPDKVMALPYRLLREVLKSDHLTSLSEEKIWQFAEVWSSSIQESGLISSMTTVV